MKPAPHNLAASDNEPTLSDVVEAIEVHPMLAPTRRRDLRSAIKRVAALLREDPSRIPLDLSAISAKLAAVNPLAAGLTPKSLADVRSDFLAAVKASGLKPVQQKSKAPLNSVWTEFMKALSEKRAHVGLSRLARFASANGINPENIDDTAIERFIAGVREGSLHRKPNDLHRNVTLIWNEVAKLPGLHLKTVVIPSFRGPPNSVRIRSGTCS